MRQVRRKTIDVTAKAYLQKAKKEGIALSWQHYEAMLPQDGFSSLGLTCFECLQGPCRLNPFADGNLTICGLTKDDLALKGLKHLIQDHELVGLAQRLASELSSRSSDGKPADAEVQRALDKYGRTAAAAREQQDMSDLELLQEAAVSQISLASLINELAGTHKSLEPRQMCAIGLGVLKEKAVNVCLEDFTPLGYLYAQQLAEECKDAALAKGAADGFNVVLVGDLGPGFNAVANKGSVEFALLTGLVDLYLTSSAGPARGKNVARHYHTVCLEASATAGKEEFRQAFFRAAEAYSCRQKERVQEASHVASLEYFVDPQYLVNSVLGGNEPQTLVLLGGGSNVKTAQDQAFVEIVKALEARDAMCVAYGNAGVTLGKYGCFSGKEASAPNKMFCLGGRWQVGTVLEIFQRSPAKKKVAVFPELCEKQDLQMALALSAARVNVLTGVRLPVDGSSRLSEEIEKAIRYCEPSTLPEEVAKLI